MGLVNQIILNTRKILRKPLHFPVVGKDNDGNYSFSEKYTSVEEVGGMQSVSHLTFHDMMAYAVTCKMNDLKYLEGLNANAVYIDQRNFERIDACKGITYFQPLLLKK